MPTITCAQAISEAGERLDNERAANASEKAHLLRIIAELRTDNVELRAELAEVRAEAAAARAHAEDLARELGDEDSDPPRPRPRAPTFFSCICEARV